MGALIIVLCNYVLVGDTVYKYCGRVSGFFGCCAVYMEG